MRALLRCSVGIAVLGVLGCTSALDIAVTIVNPCNQPAVRSVDFLKLEPRGDGIDSAGLSTVIDVSQGNAPAIKVPLANNFQLIATGHKRDREDAMAYEVTPKAIGVSPKRDLTNAKSKISLRVPFALVDAFYKTTALDAPATCSTLNVGRYGATATYLPANGKVLIVGGASLEGGMQTYTREIELYDPGTGAFARIGSLRNGGSRAFHTATLLSDGRVLIAGGEALVGVNTESLKTALIIDARDPSKLDISDGIVMRQARSGHVAARLSDGRVVLIGGRVLNRESPRAQDQMYLSSIEVYDPERGIFSFPTDAGGGTVELAAPRYGHTGTLLKTGFDVLVAGGMSRMAPNLTVEVIHFQQNVASIVTTPMPLGVGPIFHSATLAPSGAVLLTGGYSTIDDALPAFGLPMRASANVEMWEYKDQGGINRVCSSAMSTGRGFHTLSMVGRRAVMVGGRGPNGLPLASGEVADVLANGMSCFAQMPLVNMMTDARMQHAVADLPSGELIFVGGRQQDGSDDAFGHSIKSAEVFSPAREP